MKCKILPPENTVVLYARFSSNNQRDESIDAQIRAGKEWAKRKGFVIVKIYADYAKSATSDDRPEFQRMIEDSTKGLFRHVLIYKLDRFARNRYDSAIYRRKLKVNGVTILSVLENLDDSPESVVLESVLEGMAEYFSLNNGRLALVGMKESAYSYTHLGGTPPLGYGVDPLTKKYHIIESEAAIVCLIFEKYANGVGYLQILEYLNSRGYKTKRGNAFGKNSLHSILKNEKYKGEFVFNKMLEKDVSGRRNPQKKSEDEIIRVKGGVPAIIDETTFEKVQSKIARNRTTAGKYKAKEVYLFSGLIVCGECGSSMYGNTRYCGRGKSKYASYRCSDRAQHKGCKNKELRKEYLENFVLDELYTRLFSEKSIRQLTIMLNEYNQQKTQDSGHSLQSIDKAFAEVEKKISKIVYLVSECNVSIETVKPDLKRLEEQKLALLAQQGEIASEVRDNQITEEQIHGLLVRSKEFVRTKNLAECRNFIESYVQQVIVYADHVEVKFKINAPDDSGSLTPLTSTENIKALQTGYANVAV